GNTPSSQGFHLPLVDQSDVGVVVPLQRHRGPRRALLVTSSRFNNRLKLHRSCSRALDFTYQCGDRAHRSVTMRDRVESLEMTGGIQPSNNLRDKSPSHWKLLGVDSQPRADREAGVNFNCRLGESTDKASEEINGKVAPDAFGALSIQQQVSDQIQERRRSRDV